MKSILAFLVLALVALPAAAAPTKKKAAAPKAAAAPACYERACGPFNLHTCDCYKSATSSIEWCFDSMDKCNADAEKAAQ